MVLKPELKARTAFTVGDSLDDRVSFGFYAGAVTDPPAHVTPPDEQRYGRYHGDRTDRQPDVQVAGPTTRDWSTTRDQGAKEPLLTTVKPQYIEAQIFGGVKLADIKEIRYFRDKPIPEATMKKLAKAGVPVRAIPPVPSYGTYLGRGWDRYFKED